MAVTPQGNLRRTESGVSAGFTLLLSQNLLAMFFAGTKKHVHRFLRLANILWA